MQKRTSRRKSDKVKSAVAVIATAAAAALGAPPIFGTDLPTLINAAFQIFQIFQQ